MNEHKGRGRCCKTIFIIKLRPQKKEVEAGMCLLWLEVKWREVKSFSHVRLFANPWIVAHQAPPSMGFSRQEYWSGLPFLYPGDLPDPGIEPRSPTLQADALTSEPPGKLLRWQGSFNLWATREAVIRRQLISWVLTQKTIFWKFVL